MTIKEKFNEYIASGDISISDEQRDWILPFIERCVGEERSSIERILTSMSWREENETSEAIRVLAEIQKALTQEDKIK